MGAALEVLVGPEAKGLSASTVSRLKRIWAAEYKTWQHWRLDHNRWVYVWADGIYSGLRAENTRLCALVVIDRVKFVNGEEFQQPDQVAA